MRWRTEDDQEDREEDEAVIETENNQSQENKEEISGNKRVNEIICHEKDQINLKWANKTE